MDQPVRVFVILRVMLSGFRHIALPPQEGEAVVTVEVAHPLRLHALAACSLLSPLPHFAEASCGFNLRDHTVAANECRFTETASHSGCLNALRQTSL